MKNIMTIGDLHGRDVWKMFGDIPMLLKADADAAGYGVFEPEYDYYVFLGDYCDAFDKDNKAIMDNIVDVINFKKLYPDNVILLWGNHEIHYVLPSPWIHSNKYECSGYRPEMRFDLYEVFNKNFELFQMSFQVDNYLFTHAGVHKGWYNTRFDKDFYKLEAYLDRMEIDYTINNLADKLNLAFVHRMECMFDVGHLRGGHSKVGGPLWLDKKLAIKPLEKYHQVVGHTAVSSISTLKPYKDKEKTSITFIDILHHSKAFYSVNINDKN